MTLFALQFPGAPLTLTADPELVAELVAQSAVTAVFALEAVQTYPIGAQA